VQDRPCGCRKRSASSGGMAVRGLSCSDIENCRFAIMANVGGVYETEGHRICWSRFDPDAFWNRSCVSIPKQSSDVSSKQTIAPTILPWIKAPIQGRIRKPTSGSGHERGFREVHDESGLPSSPERLRQRSELTLGANFRLSRALGLQMPRRVPPTYPGDSPSVSARPTGGPSSA
jgi:hypothetical protein